MLFQQILLPSAILPTVVALVVAALGLAFREGDEEGRGTTLAGLAVSSGFAASFVAMTGLPRWLPVEASQRLFFAVILAGLASVVAVAVAKPALDWALSTAVWLVTLPALLETPLRHTWSVAQAALWLAGLFVAGLVLSAGFVRHTDASPAAPPGERAWPALPLRAVVRVLVVSSAALALGLSGTARMAQLAGAVAAAVFTVEALGFARRQTRWRAAHGVVPAVASLGLLLIGHFYAELALLPFLLLVSSLLLLGVAGEGWAQKLAPLLPLLAALALVVSAFLDQPEDPYDYYSSTPPSATERARS